MAALTSDQFLLSVINNSDLSKINFAEVAKECGLPTTGAANKRYSRWKTKIQAELAKGPTAAAEGDGDAEAGDGSESPKKTAKATPKKAKAAGAETPKKKTPAKKATSAKKRKIDEAEGEGEKAKDGPEDMDES